MNVLKSDGNIHYGFLYKDHPTRGPIYLTHIDGKFYFTGDYASKASLLKITLSGFLLMRYFFKNNLFLFLPLKEDNSMNDSFYFFLSFEFFQWKQ